MIFNTVNLSDYNLTVKQVSLSSFMPPVDTNEVEIADKAYDFRAYLKPRMINLDVVVTGTGEANLISNLDNISKVLNPINGVKHLTLDFPDSRFYKAKVSNPIDWQIVTHKLATGVLTFICPDPFGYSTSETESNHNINADPKTVTETTLGTAYIEPVYLLTAGENLTDVTIKVENVDTEEELVWVGSLTTGQELEIDVVLWIVKKVGVANMATVSGKFPRLLPALGNSIKVTGFSTTGSMKITYRNIYL